MPDEAILEPNLMRNLALYVHIPFCIRKCRYCDFVSYPVTDVPLLGSYMKCLQAESAARAVSRHVGTVYIGGGTPSILEPGQVEDLLAAVRGNFDVVQNAEITIEANPGDVSSEKADGWLAAGVNRLSLGVQSFDDGVLAFLGRRHTVSVALDSFNTARRAGFTNVSMDLIFAVPGQTPDSWRQTLARATDLNPEHISAYNLTYEQGTPLYEDVEAGRVVKVGDEDEAQMYLDAMEVLSSAGYEHYEVSNFARPGFRSAHNQTYWLNEEYIGLGTAAFSYVCGTRMSNAAGPEDYCETVHKTGTGVVERETIPHEMQMIETIIQGLRLTDGIDVARFEQRFDCALVETYRDAIAELEQQGFIVADTDRIRPTSRGLLFNNDVALRFMP